MQSITILELLDIDGKNGNHLQLSCVAGRSGLSRKLSTAMISRPGLPLTGFFSNFNSSSIQLLGRGEQDYIRLLEEKDDFHNIDKIMTSEVPCFIFTDGGVPSKRFSETAEHCAIAILSTPLNSSDFSRRAFSLLDDVFSKTETIHGVLVEVFGIGVLITGEAGVGKSETALELVERGHRLVSDDTVRLKNISDSYLIGSGESPTLAHHMEIRGIGIINLMDMYGVGAIRDKKQVQLSVHLEEWDNTKNYDRIGGGGFAEYLGIKIPRVEIPVKPGRNVPILVETAARNERLKKLGYHTAEDFGNSVQEYLEGQEAKKMFYNMEMEEDFIDK